MRKFVILAAVGLLLGGCNLAKYNLTRASVPAICQALIGPIKYNTYNRLSKRFAGYLLAMDLQQRNEVGHELHCPQYKVH